VVALVIVVGVILIVGKFAGWWGSSGIKEETSETTPEPTVSAQAVTAQDGQIAVPGIVGKSLEDAEQMLNDSKLHWQLKPVESDEEPNIVTEQDPVEGEMVDEGSRVTIYYSQGDTGVTVPDVAGKSLADARTALESENLVVGTTTEEYSSTVDKDKVISTDPVVGSSVEEGTTVNLVVSKGAESDQSVVPNLVGKKESVALERLAAAGLKGKATYIYSDQSQGKVVSQTQRSGQSVERGTTIEYSVSLGPKEEPTPTPKVEVSYRYEGSVTISTNPFESADEEPATIKLVLSQDGKSQTVWKGTLSYDDFPKEFPVQGWSENTGTVTICKNDQDLPGSYSVDFKKTAK
jgi:serine/threonine-protein kinase